MFSFHNHLFAFDAGVLAPHVNLMPCVIMGRCGDVRVNTASGTVTAQFLTIRPGIMHDVTVPQGGADIIYLDGVQMRREVADVATLTGSWTSLPNAFRSRETEVIIALRRHLNQPSPLPDPRVMEIVAQIYHAPLARLSQGQLSEMLGLERTAALRHFKATTGQWTCHALVPPQVLV